MILTYGLQFTMFNFFLVRMVPELCWASCCVKLVRYCMYMWLPMYLYQAVSTSYANNYFKLWCVVSWTCYIVVVGKYMYIYSLCKNTLFQFLVPPPFFPNLSQPVFVPSKKRNPERNGCYTGYPLGGHLKPSYLGQID